jgi:hypothetical protein
MRDKYLPGVLATDKSDHGTSEVRDREAFQVANPPLRGRAVHDLKHMELRAGPIVTTRVSPSTFRSTRC